MIPHLLARRAAVAVIPTPALRFIKRRRYVRAIPNYAQPDALVAQRFVPLGGTVVDVGANVGWYTYRFSKTVGSAGKVHAIEPVPPTFDLLAYCVRELQLENVELHNVAVSDRGGMATMRVPTSSGLRNYYRASIVASDEDGGESYEVATQTVDELVGGEDVALIKIDVEGHELEVVRGASRLLAQCRPALVVEVTEDPDDPASSGGRLRSDLEALDYAMYLVEGSSLRPRRPGDISTNYFFLQFRHRHLIENGAFDHQGS